MIRPDFETKGQILVIKITRMNLNENMPISSIMRLRSGGNDGTDFRTLHDWALPVLPGPPDEPSLFGHG
jgi:hypothetical protein